MRSGSRLPILALLAVAAPLPLARVAPAQSTDGGPARRAVAVRVQAQARAPELDGRLDDAAWATAVPATGFLLREPTEGAPAPEGTEVRFVYTHDALYIGARMFSADPAAIRTLVARRDREIPSEQLIISLDTRADRRTAYTFAITPGGVRLDYFHPGDQEGSRDYSFDPVWEARTTVDSLGWTAEIRIPFTQLRFNPGSRQVWGVNLVRRVPARNEDAYWVLVRRNETGWASRMGQLEGIEDIPPSRRIELSPYVAGSGTRSANVDPANPFVERYASRFRAGGDLKMGLGPHITLDATFNPDFGQVEADPAEVNLSAFETFFSERRPFFIEGSDLFGGRGTFYSRRIGSQPPGFATAPYAEPVDNSTILGAAKITGRLPSGLALGALTALTAREEVDTFDPATSTTAREVVAPRTVYGIVTARQEFGRDRSTLAATFTAVDRDLDNVGALLPLLVASRAYSGLIDGRLRWGGGKYDISAYYGFSTVRGDSTAILGQQLSSRRYYQRPDAQHVDVEPGRTSLTGTVAGINHSKMAGSLLWDIDYYEESPGLELNDMGALGSSDDRGISGNIRYRQTRPGRTFHNWSVGVFSNAEWNFDGDRTFSIAGVFGGVTWKNFLTTDYEVGVIPRNVSDNLTRGGPLMQNAAERYAFLGVGNRRGARTQWRVSLNGSRTEIDGSSVSINGSLSLRPATQWEVSLAPRIRRSVSARQFVANRPGGSAATFGRRYIFAYVERSEVVTQLRVNYAIRPSMTLEAYVEPFASSGQYRDFGELAAAQTFDLRTYGTGGTTITRTDSVTYTVTDGAQTFTFGVPDFDVRSLRSNVVLRWEWQPGSTLFLVWQQDRFRNTRPTGDVAADDLFEPFGIRGDHFVAVKVSYWIPVR